MVDIMSVSKERDRIMNVIKEKYGFKNLYESWSDEEWNKYFKKIKFHHKNDENSLYDDGESKFIEAMFTQAFNGLTDYKDHSDDTKDNLLEAVLENIDYSQRLQMLHFVDWGKEDLCYDILLEGYIGGWQAKFLKSKHQFLK